MNIVIVEDEKNIREELNMLLRSTGYVVTAIEDFQNPVDQIISTDPDLILLDINLPGQSGHDICKELRLLSDAPIIFLTSDDNVTTEVNSMLLGADDFITKPYHPSVLLARISAILKRVSRTSTDDHLLIHRQLTLDTRSYKATCLNHEIELSKNEFKLLSYLLERRDEIVPRLDIVEYLWDNEVFIDDNTLSVTITRIRNKLEQIGLSNYIETKRGLGYKV